MSFSKLTVAKFIATGIVGIGAGKIVNGIIKTHVKPETLIDKVTVQAASWVIAAVVSERTKKYTEEMIDDIVKTGTKVVDKVKMDSKLGRINRCESTFEQEGLDKTKFHQNAETNKWEPIKIEDEEKTEPIAVKVNPLADDN